MRVFLRAMLLAALSFSMAWGQTCDDFMPGPRDPLCVKVGMPGKPPTFSDDGDGALWAVCDQVEIWQDLGNGRNRLFARVWADESTFYECDEDRYFLLGNGPFGFRLFPAGNYWAQIRGWNPVGFGPWSIPTPFTVECPTPPPPPNLTDAPSSDEPNSDLYLQWDTDFVASQFQIEVKRGTKVVRRVTQVQNWWGYGCDGPIHGSYWDAPSSPSQELPEGAGYICRVRAYAACSRQWTPWAETMPFELANGAPPAPLPFMGQQDHEGFFDMCPRPFFCIEEDTNEARWYMFDIWRQGAKNKLTKVRQQWTRVPELGGGGNNWSPHIWMSDLPVGNYEWRVLAWNGPAAEHQVWSEPQYDTVEAAGPLDPPDVSEGAIWWGECSKWQELFWHAAPNAYTYQVELQKNGKKFRTSPWLDTAKRDISIAGGFELDFLNMDGADDIVLTPDGGSMEYTRENQPNSFAAVGGAWQSGMDEVYELDMGPFEFPFYGQNYSTCYVDIHGCLYFEQPGDTDYTPSMDEFRDRKMIAVMWNDFFDYGEPVDIHVLYDDVLEALTIRWSFGTDMNVSVTLYGTGVIEKKYGSGNEWGGLVGISAGDGENFELCTATHARPEVYWHNRVPRIPDGTYRFRVRARNTANLPAEQISPWSDWTDEIDVDTVLPGIVAMGADVNGYNVELLVNAQGTVCDEQYEVVHQGCSRYRLLTDEDELSLPPGDYKWRTRLRNVWRGWGPWSGWSEFTVEAP